MLRIMYFFGTGAGSSNTGGRSNTFVGSYTGWYNISGSNNSFYGSGAGQRNIAGNQIVKDLALSGQERLDSSDWVQIQG